MRRVLSTVFAALFASAACNRIDLPEPPDMTSTVEEFDGATASLSDSDIKAAATSAAQYSDVVARLDGLQEVTEIAEAGIAGEPLDTVDSNDSVRTPRKVLGFAIEGEVGGKVERVCGGWDDGEQAPDAATNGRISFQFTANESELGRVVWGSFERCRMLIDSTGTRVELHGDFELYLAGARGFSLGSDFIFKLDADVTIDDSPSSRIELAFRIAQGRAMVVAVPWADGHLLYTVSADQQHHELRDRDDVWACDLEARQCESTSTQRAVTW